MGCAVCWTASYIPIRLAVGAPASSILGIRLGHWTYQGQSSFWLRCGGIMTEDSKHALCVVCLFGAEGLVQGRQSRFCSLGSWWWCELDEGRPCTPGEALMQFQILAIALGREAVDG